MFRKEVLIVLAVLAVLSVIVSALVIGLSNVRYSSQELRERKERKEFLLKESGLTEQYVRCRANGKITNVGYELGYVKFICYGRGGRLDEVYVVKIPTEQTKEQ